MRFGGSPVAEKGYLLVSSLNKGNDPPVASIASINKYATGPTKIRQWHVYETPPPPAIVMLDEPPSE